MHKIAVQRVPRSLPRIRTEDVVLFRIGVSKDPSSGLFFAHTSNGRFKTRNVPEEIPINKVVEIPVTVRIEDEFITEWSNIKVDK